MIGNPNAMVFAGSQLLVRHVRVDDDTLVSDHQRPIPFRPKSTVLFQVSQTGSRYRTKDGVIMISTGGNMPEATVTTTIMNTKTIHGGDRK